MKFTFQPESKPLDGYTIKRAIHRGGFGEVYYALTDAGKEVALKLLRQHFDVELRGVSQCLNLKHANLVTIFDIKTDADGDHWVIMEFVAGKSLSQVLDDYPDGMPVDDVTKWMAGMVEGLNFLHDRGIVHRDLKPGNVFIENGVVKIGDVGLSKFISESHRSAQTQSVGTVYYMAPEVAHGRYGREVDIYSLGIVLYELLTGRVPFIGESAGEILMKHLSEKPDLPPIPRRFRPVLAQRSRRIRCAGRRRCASCWTISTRRPSVSKSRSRSRTNRSSPHDGRFVDHRSRTRSGTGARRHRQLSACPAAGSGLARSGAAGDAPELEGHLSRRRCQGDQGGRRSGPPGR